MKKSEMGLIPISLGLLSLVALLGIPSDMSTNNAMPLMYGIAIVEHYDSDENLISQQSIHNRITDQGEDLLLDQVFAGIGSTNRIDSIQVGSICIVNGIDTTLETLIAANINSANEANFPDVSIENFETGEFNDFNHAFCKTGLDTVSRESGIATIGPLTFVAGPDEFTNPSNPIINPNATNWRDTDPATPITALAVCVNTSEDQTNCSSRVFAVVALPNEIELATGDSITVSYRFNISSPDN